MISEDRAIEALGKAESICHDYSTAHLVSDEAELLRGCLNALVAIALHVMDNIPVAEKS